MSVLIKNGTVVTAENELIADIYLKGESIHAIGENLDIEADDITDPEDLVRGAQLLLNTVLSI